VAALMIITAIMAAAMALSHVFHIGMLHSASSTTMTKDQLQGQHPGLKASLAKAEVKEPHGCGKLSKELLQQYAKNNTVMITFTDHLMFKLFGSTWLYNVQKAGISYWVLAVADNRTAELVTSMKAAQCFMAEEMEVDNLHADFKWGSKTWQLHTWQKVLTVRLVNQLGFHVMHSDIDVTWFRDPMPYFLEKYTEPDYMVSMDPMTTKNKLGDDGPESGITVSHYMNTGIYFLRHTEGGRALIDKWYSIRKKQQDRGYHDQDGLYKHLTEEDREQVVWDKRYTKVIDGGKTKLAQLPATQFQNGYSHCINQIHKVHKLQPYEVHWVWVYGNNNGKMHRIREQGYFVDPYVYYREPGVGNFVVVQGQSFPLTPGGELSGRAGFVSADLTPIKTPEGFNEWRSIINDTEKMVVHHLDSVEAQLKEVYAAFAIAYTLNRTLILPKVQCWCQQNWFENPLCRMPGEYDLKFPIAPACPADFVFDMNKLYSVEVQGRRVPIREYSFLDNPRTHPFIKNDAVTAKAGDETSLSDSVVMLKKGIKDVDLVKALSGVSDKKRIHIANPRALFGGFKSESLDKEFRKAMAALPVKWCCRPDAVSKKYGKPLDHQLLMEP